MRMRLSEQKERQVVEEGGALDLEQVRQGEEEMDDIVKK